LVPVGKGPAADIGQTGTVYRSAPGETWTRIGTLYTPCGDIRAKLRAGEFEMVTPKIRDIRVGDTTLRVQTPFTGCPPKR